ncbi:MAG: glycosyltransferase family 4 protein [Acidimicrobiales bacterium]
MHVVASTDRRGAETAAVALAEELHHRGFQPTVVALAPGAGGGLEVPVLGPTRFSARTIPRLRELIAGSDVVVAHGSSTLPAVAAAAPGTGTPFVYRSIGDPSAWVNTLAREARVRLAVSTASAVVALWRGSAVWWHEHLRVPAGRITVIPNAARASDFPPVTPEQRQAARMALGLPASEPVVLCLGALSPEKRVDLAIEAVALLDGVHLAVVGDGPERSRLQSMAGAASRGRVRILGSTDRPQRALAAADALVVCSDTEGQPAVAIEAGLSGLPVVATDVGGLGEIVDDGRTGLLVPAGDAHRLAGAVSAALDRRAELGRAAAAYCAERFDLSVVAGRWQELLARAARPVA